MRTITSVMILSAVLASGCSMRPLAGDRLLAKGNLEEAEKAYRTFVGKHQTSARGQEALYRLALIYSMPDSPLFDPGRSRTALRRVIAHPEGGLYSRQASFVLSLQEEVSLLREAAVTQASLAARLESELGRMEEEAAQASSEAGAHEDRARRLTGEIRALRSQIDRLTDSLEQRERELQRIKEIDLGRLP